MKTKSDGPDGARVLTCWKPANYTLQRKGPFRQDRQKKEAYAPKPRAPVLERDNSNSVPDAIVGFVKPEGDVVVEASVAAVVVRDEDVKEPSDAWICEVCEADNPASDIVCGICMMPRETEQ